MLQNNKVKIRRVFCIALAAVLLVASILKTQQTAHAASSQGDADSALVKMYFNALFQCTSEAAHGFTQAYAQTIDGNDVVKGDAFNGIGESIEVGSLVERHVTDAKGNHDKFNDGVNGNIVCEDDNSKLLTSALKVFDEYSSKNLNLKSLICDYKDPSKHGLMQSDSKDYNCGQLFDYQVANNENKPKFSYIINDGSENYLRDYVKNAVFGGNVPGGKLSELTDVEKYYAEKTTFLAACASQSETEKGTAVYTVNLYDADAGKWRDFYFGKGTKKIKPDSALYPYTDNEGNKQKRTCSQMATDLNNVTNSVKAAYVENVKAGGSQNIQGINPAGATDDECAAASSLGWIVCPILKGLGNAIVATYSKMIEPFLKIDVSFYEDGGGTRTAWGIFQTIANVGLVIIILVVIFSQLTGIGIDNYGIKKALPKLIVAVVLINLSYILCQIAIDVSNILGVALRSLFDGFALKIPESYEESGKLLESAMAVKDQSGNTVGATVVSGTVAVAAIAGAVGYVIYTGGWVVLATLLPAVLAGLIGALVAVFFFFLLLSVRQAGVVILTVVSPVAIILYILPNTKKIFDRWIKAFSGLLLLFPISGALMGGGYFVSSLMLQGHENDFWYALIAMLMQVVPFFFIPSLLKGSFAALGNIGSKISGFGGRMGGRLGGTARRLTGSGLMSSGKVQRSRMEHIRKHQLRYNDNVANRLTRRQNAEGSLSARQKAGEELSKRQQRRLARQESRLADAKRVLGEAEAKNAQDGLVANDADYIKNTVAKSLVAGTMSQQELAQYGKEYYQEGGITYADDGKNYVGIDKDGKKVKKSYQDVQNAIANGKGRMVSYGQAKINQSAIENAKQYGSAGAYATSSKTDRAARASLAAGLNSSQSALKDTIQSGNEGVLQLSHSQAEDKRTNLQAQAQAGDAKTSFQSALTRAEGERNLKEAQDKFVSQITPEYAETLAEQRFHTSQQKMYGEEFKLQTRGKSLKAFEEAFKGANAQFKQDSDYITAAYDDLLAKGGHEDAMKVIKDNEATASQEALKTIYSKMATSSEPAMKQYGKYRVAMENIGASSADISSFSDWLAGTNVKTSFTDSQTGQTQTISADKSSFGNYIKANGNNALVGASKDAFGFYNNSTILGQISGEQILNGVVASQDNEARRAGESLLKAKIAGAANADQARLEVINSLSNSQLAKMQGSTLAAILNVSVDNLGSAVIPSALETRISELKQSINDPNNSSVFAGMSTAVRDFINKAVITPKQGTRDSGFVDENGKPLKY